jgi:hypothetical protein
MLIQPYSENQSLSAAMRRLICFGKLVTEYWMSDVNTPLRRTVEKNEKLLSENF